MVSAIVLAAGRGVRLGAGVPKPLVKIGTQEAIIYSLRALDRHPQINEIIVVASAQNKEKIAKAIKRRSFKKIKVLCLGGVRRQDSVYNGLGVVNRNSDWVLVHDSARPFITAKLISKVISEAKITKAAILGVPVKATIKSARGSLLVDKTLNRSNLWEIQTPQVFEKESILKAYRKHSKGNVTDDASLIEKLGKKVKIVMGSYENIKITTREDLLFAACLAKRSAYAI